MGRGRPFTATELRTLRRMAAAGNSSNEIGARLGRDGRTILGKASALGVRVTREKETNRWTADMRETVRLNYARFPAFLIGHVLGVSAGSVSQHAARMGLKKALDFYTQPNARLWNCVDHPNSIASRIKPGAVPPNKGIRRPGWAPGRMATTQFKKGRPAHEARNYLPIGSLRVCADGMLERKVTDDPKLVPARRWVGVHRLVWEAANGPIPSGSIIVFKPGCRSVVEAEITLDKVECITLAENMRRNTVHNLPKPIADVVRMRGVLNRAINKRQRAVDAGSQPNQRSTP